MMRSNPLLGIRTRQFGLWVLVALVMMLALANLITRDILDFDFLAAHKDGLAGLQSALASAAILIGSVAAYFKFIRGRTLSVRANVTLDAKVVPGCDGELIHLLKLTVANIGTTTIFSPQVQSAHYEGDRLDRDCGGNKCWLPRRDGESGTKAFDSIEPGETFTWVSHVSVPESAFLITHEAVVTVLGGQRWAACFVTANRSAVGEDT